MRRESKGFLGGAAVSDACREVSIQWFGGVEEMENLVVRSAEVVNEKTRHLRSES